MGPSTEEQESGGTLGGLNMGGLATWSAVQQGEDLPWGQEASAGVLTWGGQEGGSETWGWGPEVGEQTQHETQCGPSF